MKRLICLFLSALFVTACVTTLPEAPEDFEMKVIETDHFSILSFQREIEPRKPLRIYIEGDGTPNPKEAIALKLAQKDTYQNVVYITRPCQYDDDNHLCKNPDLYGKERFHPEILFELQDLIQYIGHKNQASSVELVGYDGGATIALILATKLPIKRVITIAGILDTEAYTQSNGLPSMPNALNPANEKNALARVPQIHYVGAKDKKTTKRMAERFVARLKNPVSAVVKVVPDTGHTDWTDVEFDYYEPLP